MLGRLLSWLRRPHFWFIVGLFVASLALRLSNFGHTPVSLYWDEMAIWNDARSILETGKDLFGRPWWQPIFISYGDYKMAVYIWLTAVAGTFIRDPLVAVRVPSMVAGLLAIPFSAWLMRSLFPKEKVLPWIAAGMVAFLPWVVHFSRVGFEGHVSAVFLLLSAAALWQGARLSGEKQRITLAALSLLGGIAGAASVAAYFSTRFVWPVVFVGVVLLNRRYFKKIWWGWTLAVVVWFALLLPLFTSNLRHDALKLRLSASNVLADEDRPHQVNLWRQRAGNTLISRVIYNQRGFLALDLMHNYAEYLDPGYLFVHGDANLRHGNGQVGLMYVWMLPCLLIGLLWLIRNKPEYALWLGAWWAVAILPAAIPRDVPHALRSLNAFPVYVILVSVGAWQAVLWMQQAWKKRSSRVSVGFLATAMSLLIVFEVARFFSIQQSVYPKLSASEWQDGYMQLAQYVADRQDKYERIYVDNFDDRFYLYYQPVSGLSYAEIQAIPSQDFKRELFENVHIREIDDWAFLIDNSLVVTRRERAPADWTVFETIPGSFGKEEFVSFEVHK